LKEGGKIDGALGRLSVRVSSGRLTLFNMSEESIQTHLQNLSLIDKIVSIGLFTWFFIQTLSPILYFTIFLFIISFTG